MVRAQPVAAGSDASAHSCDMSGWLSQWPLPSPRTIAHNARRRQGAGGWERGELHGHGPEHPTPQAAGTEYFSTAVDDEEVPAAERPAPLMEVLPQVGLERHGGIGYELVLSSTVPQGVQEAETDLHVFLKMVEEWEKAKEQEKEKAVARKVTVQAIPEVQIGASSHAAPPQERKGGGKVPRVIPPRQTSERIHEQSVDGPGRGYSSGAVCGAN